MSQEEIRRGVVEEADRISVHRGRRTRRLGMLAVLAFTASLWFAEGYLRYERAETQFIMSLTLPNESARAILRHVVRQESEGGKEVNATHLETLASIEEAGFVLTRYQEAYLLNPSSWSLVLNYGTRLFLENRFTDARDRFRESGVQDSENALPRYLEAAALAVAGDKDSDLGEALAIIARTNVSGGAVRFPEPLWHASLPRRGDWYERKQAEIVDRCCAPLYRLKNLIEARVRAQGVQNAYEWMAWLNTVSEMGAHLVDGGGAPTHPGEVVAGIQIQLDMLGLQRWLAGESRIDPPADAEAREARLREALNRLNSFERARAERVVSMRSLLRQPSVSIIEAAIIFVFLIVAASLTGRVLGARRFGREFVPEAWAMAVPVLMFFLFLAALAAYTTLAWRGGDNGMAAIVTLSWYLMIALGTATGLLLPLWFLPVAEDIARGLAPGAKRPPAWRLRLGTYLNLVQRLWEDQLAALVFAGCAWMIVSRIAFGLYPVQLDLLAPAFEEERAVVLHEVSTGLLPPGA